MYIYIQCSGCNGRLRVGRAHQGKRVRCPRCRQVTPIPMNDSMSPPITSDAAFSTQTADLAPDGPNDEFDSLLDTEDSKSLHPHPLGYTLSIEPTDQTATRWPVEEKAS